MNGPSVLVIAGEPSGDMHAARMIAEAVRKKPNLRFFGIGGDAMRAEGVELLHDTSQMAVLGFTEVVARYAFFRNVFKQMLTLARERKPDAVLLIDYPGFNLRFARAARAMGLKVIYYICPQVWAWNRRRIPAMARVVNRLIAIFPFERDVFAGTGLRVDFAGHPLMDATRTALAEPPAELPWRGAENRIAILPGSRAHEILRILPVMLRAALIIEKNVSNTAFILAAASPGAAALANRLVAASGNKPENFEIVTEQTRQITRQARAAMVASGTATIETALMRCPMAIVYRVAWLTYLLGRMLVKIKHLGMVNVIAGRTLCPELIQHRLTPKALAQAILPLIHNTPERAAMLEGFDEIAAKLGAGNAAERAAAILLEELP